MTIQAKNIDIVKRAAESIANLLSYTHVKAFNVNDIEESFAIETSFHPSELCVSFYETLASRLRFESYHSSTMSKVSKLFEIEDFVENSAFRAKLIRLAKEGESSYVFHGHGRVTSEDLPLLAAYLTVMHKFHVSVLDKDKIEICW